MFPLLNHSALLAAVGLAVGLFSVGGYMGYDLRRGHEAQRVADAQQVAIESARLAVEQDKQAAIERARKDALAAERARAARSRGVADANLKARNDCGWDAGSVGLLYNAIDSANDSEGAAGKLSVRVPDDPEAGERFGRIDTQLDLRSN